MINVNNKSILWSLIEKYDNHSDYSTFCDSLSRFILNTFTGDDILTVYQFSSLIDLKDKSKIDLTIGGEIENYLFSI